MLNKMANIWHNNHGSTLTICGLVVALVMSIIWRYDLVPEIGPPSITNPSLSGKRTTPQSIVVVTINSASEQNAKVSLRIVGANYGEEDPPPTIFSRFVNYSSSTTLRNGLSEMVLTDVSRGTYGAFAFIDEDGNEEVTFDADGVPLEPFAIARQTSVETPEGTLEGGFELGSEPVFLKFDFPASNSKRQSSGVKR